MGGRVDDIAVDENNPVHLLCRIRHRRHLEDHQQRHDLDADLRQVSGVVDRRHRARAVEPEHHLRRHRRAEQPPELVVRRRRLQVDRRRQGIRVRRAEGNADHRPRRRPPEGSEHRLCRGGRAPVRTEPRARALQDHRRRQDLDEHEVHRQRHRLHRRRHGSLESRTCCLPRRTSGGASRGASTAAGPAADSGRRPTAGRPGRSSPATGCPTTRSSAASASTSPARSRRRSTPRSKSARAAAPARASTTTARSCSRVRAAAAAGGGGRGQAPPPPDPKKSGIWRSDDSGKTWKFLSNQGDRWMYYSQIRDRSDQPGDRVSGRRAVLQDGRRRQDLARRSAASRTATITRSGSTRRTTTTSCSATTAASTCRTTRARPGNTSTRWRSGSSTPSAPTCGSRTTSAAACRTTAAGADRAASRSANGILNSDWFRVGGGDGFYTANDPTDWRVLYSESQDGEHEPHRLARPLGQHPSAAGGTGRARRRGGGPAGERRNAGRPAARGRSAAAPGRTWCRRRRPARTTASTGARRSSCRRTTRARSISAPTGCSAPTTAATPGRPRRI